MDGLLERKMFYRNDYIFHEGDKGYAAFLIRSGSVDICRGQGGDRQKLATLTRGQLFGEMALIDGGVRSADAIAAETTELVVITEPALKSKIAALDDFSRAWIMMLTNRLRSMNDMIQSGGPPKERQNFQDAPPEEDAPEEDVY